MLVAKDKKHLQTMVDELNKHSKLVGLQMNISKIEVMTNTKKELSITIDNKTLEQVEE